MKKNFGLALVIFLTVAAAIPGADIVPGVPVSVVVTVESKDGTAAAVSKEQLRVEENKHIRPVSEIRRLASGKSQVLLLIDDSAGSSFDVQIQDLKRFILTLPSETEVGVGYMHNGMAQMTSEFTQNHESAAKSIRLTEGPGGADVSPYDSISEAVKKWPAAEGVERREIIMISSGLEGLGGGLPPENPYVNSAIRDAQKAGVVVYAIYNPSFGHAGHSLWRSTLGQDFLSQLADETGGELYTVGIGSSVSFAPYFADFLKRQQQQYVLTFEAAAEKKGGWQAVKISATEKGISIAAPDKVFVKPSL